ncbi:MAG: hypothetical protein Q7K45_00915 [Nanoarchaeota archaeon]|nr:hypothetical protein [Nanoarchaeota archaeon]
MTIECKSKLRENARNFKMVTFEQTKRIHQDQLNHLKGLVNEYNSNLLPGEPKITIQEMAGQLERKCDVIAERILEIGKSALKNEGVGHGKQGGRK